ncbi:metal ABC transporter substrate-binding protein [Rhodopseudomonas sp. AAP120]|uniref:metal ABC transporter substrate-binding protein n=1 Tax=Rhodopseudomonas sp. AAP120 TaxID=1523430 RepID=UPI0006B9ACFB|nr:metal ABC transporter substrate-binding protein [Rhodopseudomonas sp. AAP120]KPF94697.1 metal ABC transporter substrate-binding protein [Rhodopseudomonas sp. AAP120]
MIRIAVVVLSLLAAALPARAQERIGVVASFSILGDFVRSVGGDRVAVTTLVGPTGDVHVYTPSPRDAKQIADARLVVVNGLGLEGWLPRLVQSSGGKATIVTVTKGIKTREADEGGDAHGHSHSQGHGDEHTDPHAWQSVPNAKIYVANIRDALIGADPAGEATYRANAEAYLAKLDALDREVREQVAKIPAGARKVISTHDAFGYFADAYGITFIAPQGVSTESEVSARDVARIIKQIRASKIPAVFLENISDPRLIQRIAAETGAKIGGTLYSDSLTAENGDAPTYIDMVRHNIRTLTSALAG